MAGRRFSSLTGIRVVGTNPHNGNAVWLFRCDCGEDREAAGYDVRRGKVIDCRTCGAERLRLASVKHDRSLTNEYAIWTGMKTRCFNSHAAAYPDYGGRGITVCERWLSFDAFLVDIGPRPSLTHSIERRDNDGNYEPSNCYWATLSEQAMNKRSTVRVEFRGETVTVQELSERTGVSVTTLRGRIARGLSGEVLGSALLRSGPKPKGATS